MLRHEDEDTIWQGNNIGLLLCFSVLNFKIEQKSLDILTGNVKNQLIEKVSAPSSSNFERI